MPFPKELFNFYAPEEQKTKDFLKERAKQGQIKKCPDCRKVYVGREYTICGPCDEIRKHGKPVRKHKGEAQIR